MSEPTPSLDDRINEILKPALSGYFHAGNKAPYHLADQAGADIKALIRSESDRVLNEFVEGLKARYSEVPNDTEFDMDALFDEYLAEWRNKNVQ